MDNYKVTTDCLGGKLILGEQVLMAWLPRINVKGKFQGPGWNGIIVRGVIIEHNSPTHPFAVKDELGKITVCAASCILKQDEETMRKVESMLTEVFKSTFELD